MTVPEARLMVAREHLREAQEQLRQRQAKKESDHKCSGGVFWAVSGCGGLLLGGYWGQLVAAVGILGGCWVRLAWWVGSYDHQIINPPMPGSLSRVLPKMFPQPRRALAPTNYRLPHGGELRRPQSFAMEKFRYGWDNIRVQVEFENWLLPVL